MPEIKSDCHCEIVEYQVGQTVVCPTCGLVLISAVEPAIPVPVEFAIGDKVQNAEGVVGVVTKVTTKTLNVDVDGDANGARWQRDEVVHFVEDVVPVTDVTEAVENATAEATSAVVETEVTDESN